MELFIITWFNLISSLKKKKLTEMQIQIVKCEIKIERKRKLKLCRDERE